MLTPRRKRRVARRVATLLLTLAVTSCTPRSRPAPIAHAPLSVPVRVVADTGRSMRWNVTPPPSARVWVARVDPTRAPAPLPQFSEAAPDSIPSDFSPPPALAIDDDLKPPIARNAALLRLPLPRGRRPQSVELDVRVDESGNVSDALWAGGSEDPDLVSAATECALSMRFYPAQRAGEPVAVWCRQRFDFSR